jgi:hypothetical protein
MQGGHNSRTLRGGDSSDGGVKKGKGFGGLELFELAWGLRVKKGVSFFLSSLLG